MAYLSGVEGKESGDYIFTAADATRVRDLCVKGQPSYVGIDILLTSTWPQGISRMDNKLVQIWFIFVFVNNFVLNVTTTKSIL